jgi:hypothetical protein
MLDNTNADAGGGGSNWGAFLSSFGAGEGSTDIAGFATNLAGSIAQGAAFGGPVGGALAGASSIIQTAVASIGKGRKEADIIVPVQNQVWEVLRVMIDETNLVAAGSQQATVRHLLDLYFLAVDTYRRFDRFTRDPRFTDGRASRQARDTIRPYVDGKNDAGVFDQSNPYFPKGGLLGAIERLIVARGGVAPGDAGTGGNTKAANDAEYAAVAGAAGVATAGAGGGGLMLAGAGLVIAKLLKLF